MTLRRLLPVVLASALWAGLGAVLGATPALACSCAGADSEVEYYDRADAVFVGEVLERREPGFQLLQSSDDPATYVFVVSKVYKGAVHATQEVQTARSGASCGLEIPARGTFLVYANQASSGGVMTANLCGGTRSVAGDPVPFETPSPPEAGASQTTSQSGFPLPVVGLAGLVLVGVSGAAVALWFRVRRHPA